MDDFEIQDGSNDKAYFTMVPNIVLNHSSAVDQALYMQMKRFAGERRGGGLCYASERTLMKQLKIGTKALKESLAYLQEHGWVSFSGEKTVSTEGGFQKVKAYHVNDIWKMNINHYKGASESAPLHEGASEISQGAFKRSQGASESAPIYNSRTIEPSASEDAPRMQVVEVSEFPPSKKEKDPAAAKYEQLCTWAESRRGFPFVSRAKQYAALKKAKANDIDITRLKERWVDMENDSFFSEKGFDWGAVVSSFDRKA